jgi:hypothetical protein
METIKNGQHGDLTWQLQDGTLTISGNGSLTPLKSWREGKEALKKEREELKKKLLENKIYISPTGRPTTMPTTGTDASNTLIPMVIHFSYPSTM